MRICDLTTLYIDGGEGGVNTYLTEKARDLAERSDCEHVVIVPGARSEQRRLFSTTVYTVKSPRLPSNPQHRVLANFREVKRILRATQPDLVEVDCAYFLAQVARSALPNVPVVGFYHVHLPTFIARPRASRLGPLFAGAAERMTWRYVDLCNKSCDRVVVTSTPIRDRLVQVGFKVPLEQVQLGVNLDLFHPHETKSESGPCELLYVGRLSREKDIPVLIDAFKVLTPREDYRLTIVGDGPVRGELVQQAAGDSRIRFLGRIPYGVELGARYREADLLVVPSPNETFNLTVLEGLASGLPVVAVRQGGPRELVSPEIGALARPSDSNDLARNIEAVAKREIPWRVCREHVAARSSWRRTFDRLLEVYQGACNARGVVTQR